MSRLSKKKVVPIGPLVQEPAAQSCGEDVELIQWLDKKSEASCVFVSFGSEYFLSKEDLEEIAFGLELSHVDFIWVIRFPFGSADDHEKKKIRAGEILPEGYLERINGRGRIVERWAPQAKILEHKNVGVFVSHCGWNSVTESMKYGVPTITMPMQLDQPVNARLAVEVGVGVEIIRNSNGRLQGDEVAKVLGEVNVGEMGEHVRNKAKDLSETIRLKEEREINELVKEVTNLCAKY